MIDGYLPFIFIPGLILILIWGFRVRSRNYKGAIGEKRVAKRLKKLEKKDPEKYKILNDVMINTSHGTSQIDHVVVSVYGIFVIETKNYQGWIFGNEKSEFWTQTIYMEKNKFRNPVKQNWAHIYALKELLSVFKGIEYHPIVVFSGSGVLKEITSSTPVIYSKQLVGTIKNLSMKTCLSIEYVDAIADRLSRDSLHDVSARKQHIHQVRDTIHDYEEKRRTLVCPRCGGDLILRKGKYGEFYGCSGYPKCKYTQKY